MALGQLVLWMIKPLAVLTKPKTSSPGMGLQHLPKLYFILSLDSPKIMSSESFLGSCLGLLSSGLISCGMTKGFGASIFSPIT